MSYADLARRFLAARQEETNAERSPDEINEGNEERAGLRAPAEAPTVWWRDPPGLAPILVMPPRPCIAPIACSRLGPCDRHAAGRPCLVAANEGVPGA